MENKNTVAGKDLKPTYERVIHYTFIGGFILIAIVLAFSVQMPDKADTERLQNIKALNLQRVELETLRGEQVRLVEQKGKELELAVENANRTDLNLLKVNAEIKRLQEEDIDREAVSRYKQLLLQEAEAKSLDDNYEIGKMISKDEKNSEPLAVSKPEKKLEPVKCHKANAGEELQEKIRHALFVSGGDVEFVKLLNSENGTWEHDRVSLPNSNGTRDHGLCQLNSAWHLPYIKSGDFQDWKKQMYYCYDVYKDALEKGKIATTFYAWNVRNERAEKSGLTCNK